MSYFFLVYLDLAFSLVFFVLYSVICHLSVHFCHLLDVDLLQVLGFRELH